ncbi:MAG: hypothetical protein DRP88_02465 [Candidatus Neomarinimicrobiota bacterium]|nr:MAG: hypothetical protein DRP88_02465 [Candidatus Neomarinimicrobiota bacterium]
MKLTRKIEYSIKVNYGKLIKFKSVILDLSSLDYCKMFLQSVHYVLESDNKRYKFLDILFSGVIC